MRTIKEITGKLQNTVEFSGYKCVMSFRRYNSGRLYIALIDIEDGMQVARCTLDMDSVPIIEDMVIIKDYSENIGMYDALLKANVIKPCDRKIAIGNEFGLICFLNI